MKMTGRGRWIAAALLGLLVQAAVLPAHAEDDTRDDPPGRAARLTALSGNVGIRSAGDNDWNAADENRPLTTGDALDLQSGARAEIDFGGAQVRLDGDTQAYVDRLDDNVARVDVRSGTASLDIDDVGAGSAYELRTPTIAFAPSGSGRFRVDVDHNGVSTLTLMDGEGTVYGNNGAHYDVHGNQSYRFDDPELRNVVGLPRPERDGFDRWVAEREGRYDEGPSRQYVAQGMAGAADLDAYGRWESADDYGPVWYPTTVVVQDWAPYRYGRWRMVRPWGWTWIDDAPWGYAPFHYGRWVYLRNRWGWVPGPRYVRPVYSPALVGFVGGSSWTIGFSSGPPVGWFPLGPRDVYCPPYRYSRNYFTRVNVTNVTVNRTVINNTYEDVHVHGRGNHVNYTYRNNNHATTVASRDDVENGRHLGNNRLRVSDEQLSRADLTTDLAPRGGGNNGGRGNNGRDDRPGRDNRPGGGNGNGNNGNAGRDRGDDRGGLGNAQGRDDRPGRNGGAPDRDEGRPDRGNAQVGSRDRDQDRGNGNAARDDKDRGGLGNGNAARDDKDRGGFGNGNAARNDRNRGDFGNGNADRNVTSDDRGNGNRRGGRDDVSGDDPRFTRPISPSDDRPARGNGSGGGNRNPSGNGSPSDEGRRMWTPSGDDANVRYVGPSSNPSRTYRSDPSPRSTNSGGYGGPPRSAPSPSYAQPASPPPSMDRGGGHGNPSGRGNQGPVRGDDGGGGRGNGNGANRNDRDRQPRGQGNGRDPRDQ